MAESNQTSRSMVIRNFVMIQSKRLTPFSVAKVKIYSALVCLLEDSIVVIDQAKQKLRANFSIDRMLNCAKYPIVHLVIAISRSARQIVIGCDDFIILEPVKECSCYNDKIKLGELVDSLNAYCDEILCRLLSLPVASLPFRVKGKTSGQVPPMVLQTEEECPYETFNNHPQDPDNTASNDDLSLAMPRVDQAELSSRPASEETVVHQIEST